MEPSSLLRAWREQKNLTQEDVAKLVGVDQATWSNWENNKRRPGLDSALEIEKLTGIPANAWVKKQSAESRAAESPEEDLPVSA